MITHDLDTIFRTCNRVGVIIDRKMTSDTLEGITRNPHPWIQAYFHGERAQRFGQGKATIMEREANYTAVGAFVLLVATMAGLFVYWYAGSSDARDYKRYEIYFEGSVSGLNRGSTVRYLGVEVGRVVTIRIDKRASDRVQVIADIDSLTPISDETLASLSMQGVTGLLYIDLLANAESHATSWSRCRASNIRSSTPCSRTSTGCSRAFPTSSAAPRWSSIALRACCPTTTSWRSRRPCRTSSCPRPRCPAPCATRRW